MADLRLRPPLHPSLGHRHVKFVVAEVAMPARSGLSLQEAASIGLALQLALPPGRIAGGAFCAELQSSSSWSVEARLSAVSRRNPS